MPRPSALVTGAAGFIGSHLARRLSDDGWDVRAVDSFANYYDPAIKRACADSLARVGVDVIDGDLGVLDVEKLLQGVDVVFHLAAQPGVRTSWGRDFGIYSRENIEVTQRLLEAARTVSLTRFVYSSSSSIYGDAETLPTLETARPRPVSPYGVSKLAGEHLAYLYGRSFGVPTVSLRYFTVYGPGQRPDMAFQRFIQAAVRDEQFTIYGTGEQSRDFTFVEDVVAANLAVATTQREPGTVFNVAGGHSVSLREALELLEGIHGSPLRVNYESTALGDVGRTSASIEAIRDATGWEPRVSLQEGLTRQYEAVVAALAATR